MSQKHYNSSYLEDTSKTLESLKLSSYTYFEDLKSGTILDLGCGTGKDVFTMSGQISSDVKIVGIDHDPGLLKIARTNYAENRGIEFMEADAGNLPFETNSIAGIRTERMIQHLTNADKVFSELYRVTAESAPVVVIETDWASLLFNTRYIETERKISDYLTFKKVNNGLAARTLTRYLSDSGFKNIVIRVFPIVLKTLADANKNLWIEIILNEAGEQNVVSPNDLKLFKDEIADLDSKNSFYCSINALIVSARK